MMTLPLEQVPHAAENVHQILALVGLSIGSCKAELLECRPRRLSASALVTADGGKSEYGAV
jgi:hypothetical protein